MINWKGCGRKWSGHNLRNYSGIFLEGLKKWTTKPIRITVVWDVMSCILGEGIFYFMMLSVARLLRVMTEI
jgi:hypothetical protein